MSKFLREKLVHDCSQSYQVLTNVRFISHVSPHPETTQFRIPSSHFHYLHPAFRPNVSCKVRDGDFRGLQARYTRSMILYVPQSSPLFQLSQKLSLSIVHTFFFFFEIFGKGFSPFHSLLVCLNQPSHAPLSKSRAGRAPRLRICSPTNPGSQAPATHNPLRQRPAYHLARHAMACSEQHVRCRSHGGLRLHTL